MNMKHDLKKMTLELRKLTDVDSVKAELSRIAKEIKTYNLRAKLNPEARMRLRQVETKFHGVRSKMTKIQKQVDKEVDRLVKVLKKTKADTAKKLHLSSKLQKAKKTSAKKSTGTVKKAAKATRKVSSKKTSTRK